MAQACARAHGILCLKSGPTKRCLRPRWTFCLDIQMPVRAAASIPSTFKRLYRPPISNRTNDAHHSRDYWRTQDDVTNRTYLSHIPSTDDFPRPDARENSNVGCFPVVDLGKKIHWLMRYLHFFYFSSLFSSSFLVSLRTAKFSAP